jgi:VanZ family protein
MAEALRPRPTPPGRVQRTVGGLFHAALLAYLLLAPTVNGHFHRYGDIGLLGTVGQLMGLWIIVSLAGSPPRYVRSAANLGIWLLLGLLLLHVVPWPSVGPAAEGLEVLGEWRRLLLDYGLAGRPAGSWAGRYSLIPGASVGVLLLAASAAGTYWLVASGPSNRKATYRATWATALGLALVAGWSLAGLAASAGGNANRSGRALLPVLGGDSFVPALLAGVPLACVLVLRPMDRVGRLSQRARETGLAGIVRPGPVWGGIAGLVAGLIAAALGASHVPIGLGLGCLALAVTMPLAAYVVGRRRQGMPTRLIVAAGLALGLAAAYACGRFFVAERPMVAADTTDLLGLGLDGARRWLGCGAGCLSPGLTFGWPGPAALGGRDGDTGGYALLAVEIGIVGLALALASVALLAGALAKGVVRGRSPWTRLAPAAGLGALAANALYFGFDASAVLAPNLMALAMVLGVAMAWDLHGARRGPDPARRLGEAHWPFVVGAVGMAGALGLAESAMLPPTGGISIGDKLMHFGTFGAICLLLCYALGPQPRKRWLKGRIFLAVAAATGLGAAIEAGQLLLTTDRSFEWLDMTANTLGAVLVGVFWWVLRRGQLATPAHPRAFCRRP